jgi:hypothetical protein
VQLWWRLIVQINRLTVTSPPFDDLFSLGEFDFETIAKQLWRITALGGVVCWNVSDRIVDGSESCTSAYQKIRFRDLGFRVHETLIITSSGPRKPAAQHRHPRVWQYVFVLSKGKPKAWHPILDRVNISAGGPVKVSTRDKLGRVMNTQRTGMRIRPIGTRWNVWKYTLGLNHTSKDRYAFKHPALMPEGLARDLILTFSDPGDLVLDCFAGAGTTCKMAVLTNRAYLGIEINPKFIQIAQQRIREARCK